MSEITVTVKVKGNWNDNLPPDGLGQIIEDAISRESAVLQRGGFAVLGVEAMVPEVAKLDPTSGIEEPRRLCDHCGRFLGYTHSPECDRDGQVVLEQTVAS